MNWENKFQDFYLSLKKGENNFSTTQVRDLTKIDLGNHYSLIIAVDSDGGIGPMPADTVECSEYDLGRFAVRVPLIEIIASGAFPLAAFDMLTLPMQPHGIEIIRGIRTELAEAGLGMDFPLSGSTEDNIPTTMTGVGTLVLGLVKEEDFRPGKSKAGDQVICLGLPKSAPEDVVSLQDIEIIKISELQKVAGLEIINDILPVGSRGVLHEAGQLAALAGLHFIPLTQSVVNLKKSAGPSTCALVSCQHDYLKDIKKILTSPVNNIGYLVTE
jgi:AIR synthase related protein, N-terminal domain